MTTAAPVLRSLAEVLRAPTPPPRPDTPPAAEPGWWAPGDDGPVPAIFPLVRQLLEFLNGRRPHTQLLPWLGPGALTGLESLRARVAPLGPALRRLRVQHPTAHSLEVAATLTLRTGVRALALRFSRVDPAGRWQLVAVECALTPGDRVAVRRAG